MDDKSPLKQPDPNDENQERDQKQPKIIPYFRYVIPAVLILWLLQQFLFAPFLQEPSEISYSAFKTKVAAGQIVDVIIGESSLTGTMQNPQTNTETGTASNAVTFDAAYTAGEDPTLVEELQAAGVQYSFQRPPNPIFGFVLAYSLPLLLFGGFWYFLSRRAKQGGGGLGGMFSVGKSKATEVKPEMVNVTYEDVGGADEAIAELQEIIQFLKTPEQFTVLGGHIPKGVLLIGPPGTGKTLLAKATAGEAGVPFFETSGSEFIEMFVGVGAARVRDLFVNAHRAAPAIVFIDEIDAIGRSRSGAVSMGGNDEREQTLNQLLAEIDGFKTNVGSPVIVMAATNRPEVLDPALLRAGRFDRHVAVKF